MIVLLAAIVSSGILVPAPPCLGIILIVFVAAILHDSLLFTIRVLILSELLLILYCGGGARFCSASVRWTAPNRFLPTSKI